MTIANSLNSSNASIAASDAPAGTSISTSDGNRLESDDYAAVVRWIPVVLPLLALLPVLGAYFILWAVRVAST